MSDFSAQLEAWLDASADRYEVRQTLKQTPAETTQVVYRRDGQETPVGPFVRKTFAEDAGRGTTYRQIFMAQASGRRLTHQPLIYECEHEGDTLTVVMEYVHGETLEELVAREGSGENMARRIMPQLCDAVIELHEDLGESIIHRDIKPSNIMIAQDHVVLIDLGIARTYRKEATRDTTRYGTPGYAPPEQFGYGQTNVRSDVYALGMVLAFCLTGASPRSGLRDEDLSHLGISPDLRAVLYQASQFDPDRRFASVRAFKQALEQALYNADGPTASASVPKPTWWAQHPRMGHVWNALLMGVFVLITAAFVSAVVRPTGKATGLSLPLRIVSYLGTVYIPWILMTYLLMDKTRLESVEPFSRLAGYSWWRKAAFCAIIAFVCMVVGAATYGPSS